MPTELENEEQSLRDELADVRQKIRDLTARVTDIQDPTLVDSTSQVSGNRGSQRMKMLMDREEKLLTMLNELPYCQPAEIAIGVDAIGRDLGETISE